MMGSDHTYRMADVRALTLGVLVTAGIDGMAQLWLEVDLLGDAPLDDGRDLRPL